MNRSLLHPYRLMAAAILAFSMTDACTAKTGFDLSDSLVPSEEIHLGGPPRDGIPAIDKPRFVNARKADFLSDEDQVLGLVIDGKAKAYPIPILNWHEIVNDRIASLRIAVTYCPLCGTGVILSAEAAGRNLDFGVSGLLYNSDVLLYDRQTESLWSQILRKAVAGRLRGEKLTALPMTHTTWRAWKEAYPDSKVLSTDTGYRRDYRRSPYGGYARDRDLYFPVSAKSNRYHPKERIIGLEIDGKYKVYPFAELAKSGTREINDNFAGTELKVLFDSENASAQILDVHEKQIPTITGFWFAWYAFHPETEVFTAPPK